MSKVEELLAKYNPDGVKYEEIGFNVKSLSKEILKNEFVKTQGEYPVINSGRDIQGYYSKFNNEGDAFTVASRGESAGYIQYSATPFWAGGLCYPYRSIDNGELLTKYAYYYLKKVEEFLMTKLVMRGGIPAINKHDFEKFVIPLPHIKVQEEIVKVLDSFTNLIDALNEELSLRQKQFEYYREKLLTFDESTSKIMRLGDCCSIKGRIGFRGYTIKDQVNKGEGAISLSPGNIVQGIINYNQCTYVTWDKYNESPEIMIYEGDIIFCKTGSTVGKVSVVENLPCKATINPQLVVLKDININKKYLYYCLSSNSVQNKVKSLAGVGSVPNISQSNLNDIEITVPNPSIMESIVSKLDAFESLISSLKEEIALRQKQYEYYREKLLTFE